jgi:hypothetical protein
MSDFDRTNKGSVWEVSAFSGNANVHGNEFRASLVPTGAKNDAAPAASLFLDSKERSHTIALFKPTREAKYQLSGKCDALGIRAFVYQHEKKSDRSPDYTISFLDLDDQRPAAEQAKASDPF